MTSPCNIVCETYNVILAYKETKTYKDGRCLKHLLDGVASEMIPALDVVELKMPSLKEEQH
jgi:hypothetical protein